MSKLSDLREWEGWAPTKFRQAKHNNIFRDLAKGGFVKLYVHVVRVSKFDLLTLKERINNEYAVEKRLKVQCIVAIKVYNELSTDYSSVRRQWIKLKFKNY